jgi:hypothetical protein
LVLLRLGRGEETEAKKYRKFLPKYLTRGYSMLYICSTNQPRNRKTTGPQSGEVYILNSYLTHPLNPPPRAGDLLRQKAEKFGNFNIFAPPISPETAKQQGSKAGYFHTLIQVADPMFSTEITSLSITFSTATNL